MGFLAGATSAFAQCKDDQVLVKGGFGEAQFMIELADDAGERAQGLMNREVLARSAGMLFVFERPGTVAFWMKNTLIPLDMIFVDRTGRIQHIHSNAIPHDETPIPGGDDIFAVLEINGGLSEIYGFQVGDALQHSAFLGGPALIPCKE
ncbi:DUF192 domain-containing protein [Planktotalea sp.]|uniref:DUF192 domain-containing protein n=1 Tax=Planktotalea sp. TaxID=2029877 RepID=UPI003D6A6C12